jgi:hypothetical protein
VQPSLKIVEQWPGMLLASAAPLVRRLASYAIFDDVQFADPAKCFGG